MKKSIYFKILVYSGIISFLIHSSPSDIFALDPVKEFNEYLIRTWTTKSGLPQNTINALVQTHDAYIWIGTPSGLARFDGVRFRIFTRMNTPVLKNDRILALYEDQNNALWIGTDGGGLYSYKDGLWKNYSTKNGLSNNHVKTITGDWQGNLWVGTEYGLNRFNKDGIQIFTTQNGLFDNIITALTTDSWGNLWIGAFRGGLAKFKDKVIHVYDYDDGLLNLTVNAITADQVGNIWIGTLEGFYCKRQGEEIIRQVPRAVYTLVTSIIEDEQGALWLATMTDGLNRLYNGSISGYSSEDGFPDDYVRCLIKDGDGNIWIGTDTGGLIQLKERKVYNITSENGLPQNAVSVVLQDHAGTFWIGVRNSGLCKMKNGKIVKVIDKKSGLSSNRIKALFEDNAGSLWIGTEGGGINRLRQGNITRLTTKQGLSSNNISAILEDNTDAIWIGTDNGLNKFSAGRIHIYNKKSGLSNQYIRVLLEGRDGSLYAGARGGLFKLSDDSFIKLNDKNQDTDFDVVSLYEDGEGVLWIGTNGSGLKRWFNGEMKSCTSVDGLHDNHIFSITEDDSGYIWLSSYSGVLKIKRKELNDFFENKISAVTPTCYDEAEGMISRHCIGESQPTVWKAETGKLYYPTVKGISIFNPKNIDIKTEPPSILIEDVIVGNHSIINEMPASIPFSTNRVEFRFTAFDFSAPGKIRFKYKLEGHDPDFIYVKPNSKRVADYFDLDQGKYRFIVKSANNDGIWNEQGAVFEFEILSPIYMNPIFYIVSVLIFLSIGGGVFLIQRKSKIKKQLAKYKTSTLDPERAEQAAPKLIHLMEEEKLFLNPDLTLKDLAQKLRIHYNHLSRIINERFGVSYNDFINQYRIEEVKQRLTAPEEKNKTVLEIMYDTGFYSKSVFNTAFKKFTGMTPSEYRKKYS
ncbi:MAG: helix-turn-helix domain-containing protein [Calditrichales bacterium]|nr:helix-turn-helix domain-containing protein [Calditrichales bacterium]